jgi:TonB family protein
MGFAQPHDTGHQSQALGTGISLTVHVLIFTLLLFVAFESPRQTDTPEVPIALLAPNLSRPGASGRPAGSGMESPSRRERPSDAPAPRELAAIDNPRDVLPIAVSVPAMSVDAPARLPGSAIEIDSPGRGIGPGSGSEKGSGFGGDPGAGSGPGRDGGFRGDGIGSGDGTVGLQLIREVKPAYTIDAMRAKVQGQVELEVVVLPDGTVDPKLIRITRSLDARFGLDAQAIEAVKQWRFRPARRNDRPVPVRVRVELTFTLR